MYEERCVVDENAHHMFVSEEHTSYYGTSLQIIMHTQTLQIDIFHYIAVDNTNLPIIHRQYIDQPRGIDHKIVPISRLMYEIEKIIK